MPSSESPKRQKAKPVYDPRDYDGSKRDEE
jgi:hypothetical protein